MPDPNLKIKISTEADVSGAKQAEAAIKDIGKAADKSADDIVALVKEASGLNALKRDAQRSPGGAGVPPPLPSQSPPISPLAATLGTAAGVSGLLAAAAGAQAFISNLAEGAERAAEMAQELEGLDAAARKAAVQGMGQLGELIAQNSPAIAQFARDTARIREQFDNLWTAAGARVVPALHEITGALAAIDTTSFGAQIGDAIGGAIVYTADLARSLDSLAASFTGAEGGVEILIEALARAIPGVSQTLALMDKLAEKNRQYLAEQQKSDPFAFGEAARFDRMLGLAQSLARIREDGSRKLLSLEEQITALQERRDRAIESAETLSGKSAELAAKQAQEDERQLQILQVRKQAENEATKARQDQLQATRDEIELRSRLNEAIASSNDEDRKKLEWLQNFQQAFKATGDQEIAKRAADSEQARRAQEDIRKADEQSKRDASQAAERRLQTLQDEIALIREQGKTRLAELNASGASESEMQQSRIEAAEQVRQKELEIANIRGDSTQEAKLQAEERKQEQIALTQLKRQEADATARQLAAERAISAEQNSRTQRGAITSAAHDEEISATRSGLDRWHAMQGQPSLVQPATQAPAPAQQLANLQPPGQLPAAPAAAQQPGQQGESSGVAEISKAGEGVAKKIAAAIQAMVKAFDQIGTSFTGGIDRATAALGSLGSKISGKLTDHEQRIRALEENL